MSDTRLVKLFKNGASQAVRLPSEFRFEGDEVYATRDPATGDVTLSSHPGVTAWADFFEMLHSIDIPDAFMEERPLNAVPVERDLFGEEAP